MQSTSPKKHKPHNKSSSATTHPIPEFIFQDSFPCLKLVSVSYKSRLVAEFLQLSFSTLAAAPKPPDLFSTSIQTTPPQKDATNDFLFLSRGTQAFLTNAKAIPALKERYTWLQRQSKKDGKAIWRGSYSLLQNQNLEGSPLVPLDFWQQFGPHDVLRGCTTGYWKMSEPEPQPEPASKHLPKLWPLKVCPSEHQAQNITLACRDNRP